MKHAPCSNRCFVLVVTIALFVMAMPVLAAADGIPHLDPSNNDTGATYTFTMPGSTKSMDPNLAGAKFTWKGNLIIYQDQGAADFDADMNLDLNGDSVTDRTLSCNGVVGNGRVSMRCSANDGNGELRFLVTGRAMTQPSGKVLLQRGGGRGYTDTNTLSATFQATQQ